MQVAEARGVILLALALRGVETWEYTPMQVKLSLTGYGKATKSQMAKIWKTTGQPDAWTSPVYSQFLLAVREVNSKLPASARIRVFGGDDFGPHSNQNRDRAAVTLIKERALKKRGKCLVIYGAAHFYRTYGDVNDILNEGGGDITMRLEREYPGRTFVVHPFGGPLTHPGLTGSDPAQVFC